MGSTKRQTIWTKGYTCAFLANVLLCFSQHSVNTLISTYAAFLGAGAVLVGTVSGLYFAVAFAARPFSGPAITILNKKKLLIYVYLAGVVTNVVYAFAGNIGLFIVARVLHGLQFAFVGSLSLTIASDSLPREKLGSGIGAFGIGSALAQAVGPGLGIAVRDFGTAHWGEVGAYRAVFLMAAIFMLLAVVPALIMPDPQHDGQTAKALGSWYRNIVSKETLLPTGILGLVSLASMLYSAYMLPYSESLGIPSIALFFTVYAIVLLVARPFFGRLADRADMKFVIIPSFILFIASFVVVSVGRSLPVMLIGAVLAALGFGALSPAIQTVCIKTVPPERRGVASNTQYFGMDLGYFLGPFIGGFVYKYTNYSLMYLITGVVPLALGLVIFILTWKRLKQRLY